MKRNKKEIFIKGARENNLNDIDVSIPRDRLTVVTGLSGSGKSSLAFNTMYAEGQRRYVESLSTYARQFLGLMEKPDVDYIEGLSPAISIEQKHSSRNPRSTVGTVTEIYDYLRLLFSRIGKQYCSRCDALVEKQSVKQITDSILDQEKNSKFRILAPVVKSKKGTFKDVILGIKKQGFMRLRIDGKECMVSDDINLEKNKKHDIDIVIDRLILKKGIKDRLTESVELALKVGDGTIILNAGKSDTLMSMNHACPACNISYPELEPRSFSFNSPYGACSACEGIGNEMQIDPDLVVPNHSKSLIKGCIEPIGPQPRGNWMSSILKSLSAQYGFSFSDPWNKLDPAIRDVILYGTRSKRSLVVKYESKKFKGEYKTKFEGVIPNLQRRYSQTKSRHMRQWIEKYMATQDCPSCKGLRLNSNSLSVKIGEENIVDVTKLTVKDAYNFFTSLDIIKKNDRLISEQIIKEITSRLEFLVNVGLDYLNLDRSASTLSGGESQRIRLATQIGSQLVGVLYILDEPSIGLHQRDNDRLIRTLKHLRDIGNTVVVVEHDEATMLESDWIIDLGPGAGVNGGKIVAAGTPKDLLKSKSLTGLYLSGKKKIPYRKNKRIGNGKEIVLSGARGNNLKKVQLVLPLAMFVCVTGVSGSGKSSLINQTLYPMLSTEYFQKNIKPLPYDSAEGLLCADKVINITQAPIGRTPRSNPATYTVLFTHIRDLFSSVKEAKIRGYRPGRFSFNVKGGRCNNCEGVGLIKIEMHFLADMYVVCDECGGKRYNKDTLEIEYSGKNIYDILNMDVDSALKFFSNHGPIVRKLECIQSVGLGYIKLGQAATTLSGGEAQRIKLSTELSKVSTGRTIYILDEPTTGLHFEDIKMLLEVLNSLVDQGNTVVVIEHNMDVIKSSDWVIDLGPEGGINGGEIVGAATPENLTKIKKSYTGKFLKKHLK